jgi:hypothetical protein
MKSPAEPVECSTTLSRPAKMPRTRRYRPASKEPPAWADDVIGDNLDREAAASILNEDSAASEIRSCENCRRCKLKCSRSNPCNKCAAKGIPCVYEQAEKKRGPRPGYIEELYRRIDALEHIVLGQSLILNRNSKPASSPVPTTVREAIDLERDRLGELALAYYHGEHSLPGQQQPSRLVSSIQQHSPASSTPSRELVDGQRESCQ